ncbi:MAG: hypothetical protein GX801_08920 [Fibrobacter sp.]|nr:hypothetical protein [Fibrobacter sp.]
MNNKPFKKGISYFGVRNPKLAKYDFEIIAQAGFTHILQTYSEADLQYYPETMAELIDLSAQYGLKSYINPWGVGRVFGGEAYSELTGRNPEMAQKGPQDEHFVAACPNHPGFRAYMQKWIETVCQTQVETIFWDEPHFYFEKQNPEIWACTCATCQKLFREQYGFNMPRELSSEFLAFRENSLIDFLRWATDLVKTMGKRNSVCMLPPWFPAGLDNWELVAEIPSVDELSSDPYWEKHTPRSEIAPTYNHTAQKLVGLAEKFQKDAQIWIKNYHIVAGTEDFIDIATQTSINKGIRNIFAWSYMGSEYMSWLKSDNPSLVWQTQIQALKKLN